MSPERTPARPSSCALLAGAGYGARLGRGPKAFLEIAGATLLEWSVRAVGEHVDEVVVAVPRAEVERAARLVPTASVIAGGDTRQQTVLGLLRGSSGSLCLVHDVARPCLPAAVTERVLEAAARSGGASASRPVADTLVRRADGATVDREGLRAVQTPQAFRRDLLERAHLRAQEEGLEATDDASLVRALGQEVELVDGSPWLFKITNREDLRFARRVMATWRETSAAL